MQLVKLEPGTTYATDWTIVKLLGSGAFGSVYHAINRTNGHNYAMKLESINAETKLLQMEVMVLDELDRNKRARHFCKIYARGREQGANYVAMTMVSDSLHQLRTSRQSQHFTVCTAISAGIQMLEALEDLHSIGYLHRDVKPDNYTIGRREKDDHKNIYLLDFGMARKFINAEGHLHRPRAQAGFRGTPRYASLNTHRDEDQGRRDDVEGWFYSLVEITNGVLPWRHLSYTDLEAIGKAKQRVSDSHDERVRMLVGCPTEYLQIYDYIRKLNFYARPDYHGLYEMLRAAMRRLNCQVPPYDWESSPH